MSDGEQDGMQHFDGEIEKLVRDGRHHARHRLSYAHQPGNLRVELADVAEEAEAAESDIVR